MEKYPGLSRLISLETRLPYHPNHEEGHFEDEQCGKRLKDFFSTPALLAADTVRRHQHWQ
jgi:hypothetical protein